MFGIAMLMAGGALMAGEKLGKFTWRSKLGVCLFYGGVLVAVFAGDW